MIYQLNNFYKNYQIAWIKGNYNSYEIGYSYKKT